MSTKKFIGYQGTGKTKFVVELARENPDATIVCENVDEMYRKLDGYELFGRKVISFTEFIERVKQGVQDSKERYIIDGLDMLVAEEPEIIGYSFSAEVN